MHLGTEIFNRRLANWIQEYIKGAKLGRGHGLGKAEQKGLLGDEIITWDSEDRAGDRSLW